MNKTKQKIRSQQQLLKKRIFKTWKNPHCEYCGNPNKNILQLHHIKSICNGGDNSIDNVIILCPNCHKMVHAGQITTKELKTLKQFPKLFINFEDLQTKMNKLKQNADKLEQIVKDRDKYIEQLNSEWWYVFKDIQEKEKYLKDNNTKFQLCKYIDRVEYKYNQLLEENKKLIEENKILKQIISDDKKYVKKSFFDFLNNMWHGFSL